MREAKYTEYLGKYLETHSLPSEFAEISGFSDLFTATFIDREIGFETEELFEIKISAKSAIVIPLYKERIEQLTAAWESVENAEKVISENVQEATVDSMTIGAQKTKITELPLNTTSAIPNTEQAADSYTNANARNNSRNYQRNESGVTTPEAYDIIDRLHKEVYNIMRILLREFEPLFMGVY